MNWKQAGLFGKGEAWEHGRYPAEYETLAWGPGYFPFLYGARPDSTYDPSRRQRPHQLGTLPRHVGLTRRIRHRRQP